MATSLTIMPLRIKQELADREILCYDSLRFDDQRAIFAQISGGESIAPELGLEVIVHAKPLPPKTKVAMHNDERVYSTRKDAYDDELTYALAREMKKIKRPENITPRNNAIMAYLRALPGDTPIILFWH